MVCLHDSFQFLELLAGVNVLAYCAIALPQLPVVGTFVAACNFAAFAVMALLSLNSDWVPTDTIALVSLLVILGMFFYTLIDSGGAIVSSLLGGLLVGPIAIQSRSHIHTWLAKHLVDVSDLFLVILILVALVILLYVYGLSKNSVWIQLAVSNAIFAFLLVVSLRAFVIQRYVLEGEEQMCCGKDFETRQCPFVFNWWMLLVLAAAYVFRLVLSSLALRAKHKRLVLAQVQNIERRVRRELQYEEVPQHEDEQLEMQRLLPMRNVPEALRVDAQHT